MGILVSIKNAVERSSGLAGDFIPEVIPDDLLTFRPLTFDDYVVALQAERTCIVSPYAQAATSPSNDSPTLWISGIFDKGVNWAVPFVKCDSRECERAGQDAQSFCEYGILAVSGKDEMDEGGTERAQQFKAWLYDQYPALKNENGEMPFAHDFCPIFASQASMDEYIGNQHYGSLKVPKIIMGIVFEGNDNQVFKYTLRQNSTNFNAQEAEARPSARTTPDTSVTLSSYAKTEDSVCAPEGGTPELGYLQSSCTGQYIYNGVLPMQRLVHDFMFNVTQAADKGYFVSEAGVAFVPFPSPSFEENGFYASVGSKYIIVVVFCH
jgi:hypothetical protein